MTYLSRASVVVSASLVCPDLYLSSSTPICETIRSLTLTGIELREGAEPFTALGDSLPSLKRLTLRLASSTEVNRRFRIKVFDHVMFEEAHFKDIGAAFPDLTSLELGGLCEDPSGDTLKATLRRYPMVDIALKQLDPSHPFFDGHPSAAPVLQAMPTLRSLRLRLPKDFESASALCKHIAEGQMPLLGYIKLTSSFGASKRQVDRVVIRDAVVGEMEACGFKVKKHGALTKVSGSRKV